MEAGRQLNDALSWAAVFVREVRFFSAENILFFGSNRGLLVSKSPHTEKQRHLELWTLP